VLVSETINDVLSRMLNNTQLNSTQLEWCQTLSVLNQL